MRKKERWERCTTLIVQEPNDNNKEIYKLKHLLNIIIKAKPPRKKNVIGQYEKYGHMVWHVRQMYDRKKK